MEIVFLDPQNEIDQYTKEHIIKVLNSNTENDIYYMFFWQSINAIMKKKKFPLCVEEVLKVIVRVIDKETTEVKAYIINKWERCRFCEIIYKAQAVLCAGSIKNINEAELKAYWSRRR